MKFEDVVKQLAVKWLFRKAFVGARRRNSFYFDPKRILGEELYLLSASLASFNNNLYLEMQNYVENKLRKNGYNEREIDLAKSIAIDYIYILANKVVWAYAETQDPVRTFDRIVKYVAKSTGMEKEQAKKWHHMISIC